MNVSLMVMKKRFLTLLWVLSYHSPMYKPYMPLHGLALSWRSQKDFKNDEYEYEYYSEFEKLFEYYSWEIFE